MILHIPHSSAKFPNDTYIPNGVRQFTDWFTNKIFDKHFYMVYPYSRYHCDVERLESEQDEILQTIDTDGTVYRTLSESDSDAILLEYKKWHTELKTNAEFQASYLDNVVVVDCHSFSASQLNMSESDVPDICIGYNDYNALPQEVMAQVARLYEINGYSVRFNFPYANAIVASKLPNVYSIMLEVNKRLYLDDSGNTPELLYNWKRLRDVNRMVLSYLTQFELGINEP